MENQKEGVPCNGYWWIYEMDAIINLQELDASAVLVGVFIIMSAIIAIYEIIGKFSKVIGKPVKWVRQKEEDHELLKMTVQNLSELQSRYNVFESATLKADEDIRKDVSDLTKMFIDKQMDDMRYEILDFASAISLGRNYTKEQYIHTIKICDKYHRIIKERKLENGEADISTKLIKDSFEDKMKNGAFS